MQIIVSTLTVGSMIVIAGFIAYAMTRSGVPIWLAFIWTVIFSAGIGVAIEFVAIRPLGRFDPTTNVAWILTTFSIGRVTVDAAAHPLPALVGSFFGWNGSRVAGVAITPTDGVIVFAALSLMVGLE